MTKKVILFAFLITSLLINAQKAQRFGYVDMEYILENIPDYMEAQAKINAKARTWESNIEAKQKEIDDLIADLNNEKALLTKELVEDKEEDIKIKELELKKLQNAYFGTNGDLFFLRRQLVKPIQDLVFNAVQDIASKRKYDFVFDKSTDLIMLYSNKQYDISDMVITNISRAQKTEAATEKRKEKSKKKNAAQPVELSPEAQQKVDARELKRLELQKNIEAKKAEQLKKREELLKANEEKKQQRLIDTEAAKEKSTTTKTETVIEEAEVEEIIIDETENVEAEQKLSEKELKRAALQKSIEEKRAEQLKKREALLKANEAKKQQRIKDIEDAKKAKEAKLLEQQESN